MAQTTDSKSTDKPTGGAESTRTAAGAASTRGPASTAPADVEGGAVEVDPRLDNRRGAQRPPVEEWPAVPQQVDGPDVTDPPDRDARPHQATGDDRPRKGMRSSGPHGLGDRDQG